MFARGGRACPTNARLRTTEAAIFPPIEQTETHDPAAFEALLGLIVTHGAAATGEKDPTGHLGLLIRDPETRAIVGGLWAMTYYEWMYVDWLILPETMRGQGLGSELMRRAEAMARARHCRGMWLNSFTFQAPGFYEKLGFTRFGELPDYPLGHARVFLAKRLDGSEPA